MATKAIMKKTCLNRKPIVSFGLITDIHYTNNDDRWNYDQTFLRHYRNSLNLVQQACQQWLNQKYPVSFVIQLGDIIDRLCQIDKTSVIDLKTILEQFNSISSIYHIWGNHELYNFTRNDLLNGPLCSFNTKDISPAHYGIIEVCSNLKILALDTYELSLLGVDKHSDLYVQALNYIKKSNKNSNLNDPTGLDGYNQRFIELNGGLTEKQLNWLKQQLIDAKNHHENVIIIGHIPIHPKAGDQLALLWNYEEVLEIFSTFNDIILIYLAGHAHEGGYYYDEKNQIHHLTLHAIVECEVTSNAYANVYVYQEYLIIEGIGRIATYQIEMKQKC